MELIKNSLVLSPLQIQLWVICLWKSRNFEKNISSHVTDEINVAATYAILRLLKLGNYLQAAVAHVLLGTR